MENIKTDFYLVHPGQHKRLNPVMGATIFSPNAIDTGHLCGEAGGGPAGDFV
jgi:hypothetical protein